MSFINKKLPTLYFILNSRSKGATNLSSSHKNPIFYYLLRFSSYSSSSSAIKAPSLKSSFTQDYLISSCGFSPQKALVTSKQFANFTSAENPNSVRHFFKHLGFSDAHIHSIITGCPHILCADVNQTLEPNLRSLRRMGFSEIDLLRLIPRNPKVLVLTSAIPRIDFWRSFLDNDMKKLVLALTRNLGLVCHDVSTGFAQKVSLLTEYGLSPAQIQTLVWLRPGFITKSEALMELLLKRTQAFGFQQGSDMFMRGLSTLSGLGSDRLKAKMELYTSFGWSEQEFKSAIRKYPTFVSISDENVRAKMNFLVEKVGCSQSYIASHPRLLCFSLVKRLMPRYEVVKILRSNELDFRDLHALFNYPEKNFIQKYILRYEEVAPKLHETYIAACK